MQIFTVRSVPKVSWSSPDPFNMRPGVVTVFWLTLGLFLFGVGETFLIASGIGVTPWTVLAQGIGRTFDLGIGAATFVISIGVLLLWIPLKQRPGIGMVLNTCIIAATIEYFLPFVPVTDSYPLSLMQVFCGILLVGFGSGLYLVANLGPGTRDGLMTGLQSVSGWPVAWVRAAIELTVIACGWALGGVFGVGTILFALGIGPAVSAGLYLTGRFFRPPVADEEEQAS